MADTGGNSAGGPQNPIITAYNNFAERTPFVTRVSMVGVVFFYLFSWIYDMDKALGNVTYFTVFRFEIYRILLNPIVGNSLLNTIFMAMFYPAMGSKLEGSMSSALFLWLIGFITLATNVAFNFCCLLLYTINMPAAIFYSCSGFWTILFGLITIECMLQPEAPRQLMFIPVQIPSMYFPLVLYAFFSLFSGPQLDFAIAMGVGYCYSKGFLDRFRPSSTYLEGLEAAGGFLHAISRSRGWVLSGGALGHDAWIPMNAQQMERDRAQEASGTYSQGGFGGFGSGGGGYSAVPKTDPSAAKKPDVFAGPAQKLGSTGSTPSKADREAIAARRAEKLASGGQTNV